METKESKIYEEKYKSCYGHSYPESHIIRVYERFLKGNLSEGKTLRILDYGCGTGANLLFFKDKGFDVYGCDASKTAIQRCRVNERFKDSQFAVCDEIPNPFELFGSLSFDLILSNQTLYYLSDSLLRKFVAETYDLTNEGGFMVATMVAKSHWFYSRAITQEGDFHKIDLHRTRFNQFSYINFKEKDELEELFSPFKKSLIGFYTQNILPEEGPNDHWIYIGRK